MVEKIGYSWGEKPGTISITFIEETEQGYYYERGETVTLPPEETRSVTELLEEKGFLIVPREEYQEYAKEALAQTQRKIAKEKEESRKHAIERRANKDTTLLEQLRTGGYSGQWDYHTPIWREYTPEEMRIKQGAAAESAVSMTVLREEPKYTEHNPTFEEAYAIGMQLSPQNTGAEGMLFHKEPDGGISSSPLGTLYIGCYGLEAAERLIDAGLTSGHQAEQEIIRAIEAGIRNLFRADGTTRDLSYHYTLYVSGAVRGSQHKPRANPWYHDLVDSMSTSVHAKSKTELFLTIQEIEGRLQQDIHTHKDNGSWREKNALRRHKEEEQRILQGRRDDQMQKIEALAQELGFPLADGEAKGRIQIWSKPQAIWNAMVNNPSAAKTGEEVFPFRVVVEEVPQDEDWVRLSTRDINTYSRKPIWVHIEARTHSLSAGRLVQLVTAYPALIPIVEGKEQPICRLENGKAVFYATSRQMIEEIETNPYLDATLKSGEDVEVTSAQIVDFSVLNKTVSTRFNDKGVYENQHREEAQAALERYRLSLLEITVGNHGNSYFVPDACRDELQKYQQDLEITLARI